MPPTKGATDSAEESRLDLLHELKVLDTEPEASFDSLTAVAADLCGRPISLVSLVDSQRQFFKSRHGLEVTETPRDISFCSHAITNEHRDAEIFEVSDTHADERFANNPLVLGPPNIRHYAGVPLRPTGETAVGTLCVIGPDAGVLDDAQRAGLLRLANVAEELLRLRLVARLEADAHERAERSEQHYRYLVDNTADIVFIHDANLVTRYMSPNAPEFLGYTYDEVIAFGSGHAVFHPKDAERLVDSFSGLTLEQPTTTLRVRAINKDGTIRHVAVHTKAIFVDGALEEFQTSARDIGDVVAYEHELKETNLQLRALVEQRTALMRGITHDLAAPVAAIRVTIESLQTQLTDDAMINQCDRLMEFASSLEAFVSDLRSVAQPEHAGYALQLTRLAARPVVEHAIAQVPHIASSRLTVALDDIYALADRQALARITTNLLTNAYKHTPPGTPVTVSLFAEDEMAVIRVADLGPGIPVAERAKAFEPYVSSDPEGTGLGLAITKALVEAQHGTIQMESNDPSGAIFSVRLPLLSNEEGPDSPPAAQG